MPHDAPAENPARSPATLQGGADGAPGTGPRRVNLRESLIQAGLDLLESGGPEALTLRRAAARAGVSHAAPAHHFDGLPGLMTAIAARAFALFIEAMESRRRAAPPEPMAQLAALCAGYQDFAEEHGGLFHVMFNHGDVNHADPELCVLSARAYGILREGCMPFASDDAPDRVLELAVWSMTHGFAALRLSGARSKTPDGLTPPSFEHLLQRLADAMGKPLAPAPRLR
ncbi:MAG: TetR/AcrR family transcriptional regulator [Pararhodobacter sp.]